MLRQRMMGWSLNLLLLVIATLMLYQLYLQRDVALGAVAYWYRQVGPVMLGLLPLTAYFLSLLGRAVVARDFRSDRFARGLDIVIFVAPLLGMLGTVDGLREALQQFYQIKGVDNLMEVLGEFLKGASRMLYTTEWGLLLVLPAGLLKKVLFGKKQRKSLNDIPVPSRQAIRPKREGVTCAVNKAAG